MRNTRKLERRQPENAKLRVYIDAIRDAKKHTNESWCENLIKGNIEYISLEDWISYLEQCALNEASVICNISA